ncbi:type IV secretion system protein [Vibrio vulnificus]
MSQGYTFFSDIFEYIVNDLIQDSIYDAIASVSHLISMGMAAGFGLYSVYFAFQIMFNRADVPIMDCLRKLALLSIVTTFSLNTSNFNSTVVPIVLGSGEELGGALIGGDTAAKALDQFSTVIINTIVDIWSNSELDWFSGNMLVSALNIIVILVGAIPFLATTFGILLTAKVMVALLLSVGTMYICFAFFEQTRQWFMQWVGMCLNYTLLVFMFPIALSIQLHAIDSFVYVNGQMSVSITSAFKLALVLLAFLAISIQIPVLASSLSGGVGINGMSSSFSSMVNAAAPAAKGAGFFARLAGRGANAGYKSAKEKYKNRGNNISAG